MWHSTVIKVLHETKKSAATTVASLVVHADKVHGDCEARGLLLKEQCGFRPYHSTLDMIFAVQRLEEHRRKARVPLCLCFANLRKIYYSVDRSLLWWVPARYGVPSRMIAIIYQFHDETRTCVRNHNSDCSEEFYIE